MDSSSILCVHGCRDLRQCIVDACKRLSTDPDTQAELLRHAWMVLSLMPAQRTDTYYRDVAYVAIRKRMDVLIWGST